MCAEASAGRRNGDGFQGLHEWRNSTQGFRGKNDHFKLETILKYEILDGIGIIFES